MLVGHGTGENNCVGEFERMLVHYQIRIVLGGIWHKLNDRDCMLVLHPRVEGLETLEKVSNMFKVNNKNTRTVSILQHFQRIFTLSALCEKCWNTEFFSGPNTEKYGPVKTKYLDTFDAV